MGFLNPSNLVSSLQKQAKNIDFIKDSALVNANPQTIQVGNNPIISELQRLGNKVQIPGVGGLGQFIPQLSPFPTKKHVLFQLRDRDGNLAKPPPGNLDGFREGFTFRMLVNPSNFAITQPPKTVTPVRTLGGWRLQYWYPELGSIRADGLIGNMLERFNKDLKNSDAWRSFRKLLSIYRNNGVRYFPPTVSDRSQAQARFIPRVICFFDKFEYEGYFESMEYTESEETPHTLRYSFTFKFTNVRDLRDMQEMTGESFFDESNLPKQASSVNQGSVPGGV